MDRMLRRVLVALCRADGVGMSVHAAFRAGAVAGVAAECALRWSEAPTAAALYWLIAAAAFLYYAVRGA